MNALGKPEAEALRELTKSLKILGLSPVQCAIGSRIMKLLAVQDVGVEAAEHFITNIFKKCENLRVTPSQFVTCIEDIMSFSDHVRLHEIPNYMDQKISEKNQVEKELEQVNVRKCSKVYPF